MTLLGWRFADLVHALADIGVKEDEVLLRNRIGHGRFRASLFLQCLMAMGVDELKLPLIVDLVDRDPSAPANSTKDHDRNSTQSPSESPTEY